MNIPLKMREEFGYKVKNISDHAHKELLPGDVFRIFTEEYVNISSPVTIDEIHYVQRDGIEANITLEYNGKKASITNNGNGRLDAVSNALKSYLGLKYTIETYTEHALESSSASKAVSYVAIKNEDGSLSWGTGIDTDIIISSAKALVSAVNKSMKESRV